MSTREAINTIPDGYTVKNRVKVVCAEQGTTITEIGRKLGLSKQQSHRLGRDVTAAIERALAVAHELNCSLDDLYQLVPVDGSTADG